MLSSAFRGLKKQNAACCPSVLCYTEKLSSGMNGRSMTVKTAGGQELLLAMFTNTQTWKTLEMLFMDLFSSSFTGNKIPLMQIIG